MHKFMHVQNYLYSIHQQVGNDFNKGTLKWHVQAS